MNSKELYDAYQDKKEEFHTYINEIQQKVDIDIFTIINPTLIKNPFVSVFPKKFFLSKLSMKNHFILFVKNSLRYLFLNISQLLLYIISFILYKIYFKKNENNSRDILIDIFSSVDLVNTSKALNEGYFPILYPILEKRNVEYTLLLRFYGIGKNPFKLIQFFKILNGSKHDFLIEFELLKIKDFLEIFWLILITPFHVLKLIQPIKTRKDQIFNEALFEDIPSISFASFTRYILGQNISKLKNVKKIYSWSEFQVIERSFNYAIRKNNTSISLIACQFFINYETYFNSYVNDLDYELKISPHEVLVNGKYYILQRESVKYFAGVSLRYQKLFNFQGIIQERDIILLGSYIEDDSKYLLQCIEQFRDIIFKNHPAVNIEKLGVIPSNISVTQEDIYTLFEHAKLVIGSASGSLVEAVACGVSVIVIASKDNLTANPLVGQGQGKIWDIALSKEEVFELYDRLTDYRSKNSEEIKELALWYKENFFIEPTEENILKAFGLEKE